jgi:hypothetical protein
MKLQLIILLILNSICVEGLNFNSVGLNDYKLNTHITEYPEIVKAGVSDIDKSVDVFYKEESTIVLGKKVTVKYSFAFKNNKLKAYTFTFLIGKDYPFYKKFVKKTSIDNKFIKEKRIYFLTRSQNCTKYLRFRYNLENELIIIGGISEIGHW